MSREERSSPNDRRYAQFVTRGAAGCAAIGLAAAVVYVGMAVWGEDDTPERGLYLTLYAPVVCLVAALGGAVAGALGGLVLAVVGPGRKSSGPAE